MFSGCHIETAAASPQPPLKRREKRNNCSCRPPLPSLPCLCLFSHNYRLCNLTPFTPSQQGALVPSHLPIICSLSLNLSLSLVPPAVYVYFSGWILVVFPSTETIGRGEGGEPAGPFKTLIWTERKWGLSLSLFNALKIMTKAAFFPR